MLFCARRYLQLGIGILLLGPGVANAATIGASFAGSFTSVTDPSGYLPAIGIGSLFTVEYSVDTDGASGISVSNGTYYPFYISPASPGVISATVSGVPFSGLLDAITVGDNVFGGSFDYWATGFRVSDPPLSVGDIFPSLVFSDATGTVLGSEALFGVNSLVGWSQAEMHLHRVDSLGAEPVLQTLATGNLNSVIPEPTTGSLVATGLLSMGLRSRRRGRPGRSGMLR